MDLGRNHTCFCTKTLVMTPAVLHTSFWPHGADLHKLYRSESHIYAQWLWHAQERWEWWWSRKVSAQSDEQVLSLWATKRHTCWKLSYKGLILLPKAGSELEPLQQITLLHVMTLLKAGSHTETQHQPASSTGCYTIDCITPPAPYFPAWPPPPFSGRRSSLSIKERRLTVSACWWIISCR